MFNIELKETSTDNLIIFKGDATINYANDIVGQFKTFPAGKPYTLDYSEISATDITFIQVLVSFKQKVPSLTLAGQGSAVFDDMLKALNLTHLFNT